MSPLLVRIDTYLPWFHDKCVKPRTWARMYKQFTFRAVEVFFIYRFAGAKKTCRFENAKSVSSRHYL
jgi:hypothetical protein